MDLSEQSPASSVHYSSSVSPTEVTPPALEQFVRREEKFLLPNGLREQFMSLVTRHLSPCYPDPTTEYTLIESVYMDSLELRSFRDHFARLPERFKLRTRRYGPNGIWDDSAQAKTFLELKMKRNDITDKLRLKLDAQDRLRLMSGGTLKGRKKKVQISDEINTVIRETKPIPVSQVVYRRFAYEEGGLRVTMDDQLQVRLQRDLPWSLWERLKQEPWWNDAVSMAAAFVGQDVSLVEVKHSGFVPDWLIQFMEKNNIQYRGFSKYCYSIITALKGV